MAQPADDGTFVYHLTQLCMEEGIRVAGARLFWHQSARIFSPLVQGATTNVMLPVEATDVFVSTLHAVMTDEATRAQARAKASRPSDIDEVEIPRAKEFLSGVMGAPPDSVVMAAARDFPFQFVAAPAIAKVTDGINSVLPLRRNDRAGVPSLQLSFPMTETFKADPYACSALIRVIVKLGVKALHHAIDDRGMVHANADLLLEDHIMTTGDRVIIYLRLLPTYRLVRRDRVLSEMTHLVSAAPPDDPADAPNGNKKNKMRALLNTYRTMLEKTITVSQ